MNTPVLVWWFLWPGGGGFWFIKRWFNQMVLQVAPILIKVTQGEILNDLKSNFTLAPCLCSLALAASRPDSSEVGGSSQLECHYLARAPPRTGSCSTQTASQRHLRIAWWSPVIYSRFNLTFSCEMLKLLLKPSCILILALDTGPNQHPVIFSKIRFLKQMVQW